ncbi:calmodulin-like [Mytilus edulis]|uniref:calmodulin-like n=1 Tax=Mytilus edulis TaxID=6550 RepID=UPI0039EE5B78
MEHKDETRQMRETSNEATIKIVFDKLDANHDGHITPEELMNAGKEVGIKINLTRATKLIDEIDKEGHGFVNFTEFRKCMQQVLAKIHRDNEIYKRSFKKFDADGNGFIDKDELRQVLCAGGGRKMSEDEAEEMFNEADIDQDGQLTFDEFVDYFCRI